MLFTNVSLEKIAAPIEMQFVGQNQVRRASSL